MSHCFSTELASEAGLSDQRFPTTKEEADLVEDALVRDLQRMSLSEQERDLFELHGICEDDPEEPAMVELKKKEMEIALTKLASKGAYEEAFRMNADYVKSYFLAFLRSERFDAQLAAEKIAMHFDVKRRIFGNSEILVRDIKQSDLGPNELLLLRKGFMQPCPLPDSSGRGVVCMTPCHESGNFDICTTNRAIFYCGSVALHDEEIQKKGIVWILLNYENTVGSFEFDKIVYNVEKSLPARIAGMHYCYTDEKLRPYVLGAIAFSTRLDRYRKRQHLGTPKEIEFELQTFGIPTHALPVKRDGSASTDFFLKWLERQRVKEEKETGLPTMAIGEQEDSAGVIKTPGRFDVLLGRAGPCREHTGTRRAALLCEMYFDIYEKATKFQKTDVSEKILAIIRESGGRFLKRTSSGWIRADDMEARNKISHFFRYMRCKTQSEKA